MANNEQLISTFNKFVSLHQRPKGDKDTTHTTYNGKLYRFLGDDYQKFLDTYIDIVKNIPNYKLHFIEKPNINGVTYLFVDVDYDQNGSKRQYTEKHITQFIKKINTFLNENFDVSDCQLTTFVTEKAKPTKRGDTNVYKDGFHICYPHLPMKDEYRYYILDHLDVLIKNKDLLKNISFNKDFDISVIIDRRIIRSNGITMIGSQKLDGTYYSLTYTYNNNLRSLGTEDYEIDEIIRTLSNQQFDQDASVEPIDDQDILDRIAENYRQYNRGIKKKQEPIKNNTKKSKSEIQSKHDDQNQDSDDYDNISSVNDDDDYDSDDDNESRLNKHKNKKSVTEKRDIEMAKALCKILSKKRAHDFVAWRRVGMALKAIDVSLFNDFVTFSKKDMAKYREGKVTCEDVWKIADEYLEYYSIETLRHWARLDNSEAYYDVIRRLNDDVFGKAESSKHVDIAQVVHELYKDRFVCVDIVKKKWYEFQDHRWIAVQSAYTLEELISDEVRKMITKFCLEKLTASAKDGFDHDAEYKKYHKLMRMIDNLGDVKFRENVVRACANKFYDPLFQAKLDGNVYLVGFNNGIYDLKDGCFRDGLPSDFVSKSVCYDWKVFKDSDPIFKKINKFFSEIQADEDMRDYLLTFIAKTLRGVPDSKLHIWTGGGGNGKSAVVDLIKNMLGDYYGMVPVSIITRKRGASSSASPELADKYGKRFLVIQEPEHNDVVFVGQMKEYTGKDTIMARPLYGDPFYYVPQFTMVLTCNNLPYIPAQDNGTWRRLRVTPFEAEFVDENPVGPLQFLKDEELQEEFPKWAQPLIWMIITKYYPIYAKGINGKPHKLNEPLKVKQSTNAYKVDTDVYAEFLDENLTITKDPNDTEGFMFLFETFRQWYQTSYTDKAPAKKTFKAYLKKNGFKMDNQKIYGVKYALGLI
jgi:P4 family phage/plasmid primase-like protien